MWKSLCLLTGLLLLGGGAYGGKKVKGTGYAANAIPPDISNPPPGWMGPGNAHDPDVGVLFDGVTQYELRQGPDHDNKQHWRATDYIQWQVSGATLEAEGQATDSDSDEATTVSSETWGAHVVAAKVTPAEGDWGEIAAENEVSFEHGYQISGKYIGEASVQLRGKAVDIEGRTHSFDLSAQVGESSARRVDNKVGLAIGGAHDVGGAVATNGASLGGSRSAAFEMVKTIGVSIVHRFGEGKSDSGSTPTARVEDEVTGPTPLEKDYDVFSSGAVTLLARAGKAPDDEGATSVVVHVEKFKVQNTLTVETDAWWKTTPPPPGPPPPPGETPTPGTGGGGDDDDDEPPPPPPPPPPEDGPTTPEEDEPTTPEEEEEEEEEVPEPDAPVGPDDSVPLPPHDDLTATPSISAPHGLEGEGGALAGSLRVRLNRPAPTDITFVLEADPVDTLDFAGAETLVVRQGRVWGSVPFHALAAEPVAITLRPLDDTGAPMDAALLQELEPRSVEDHHELVIWATVDGKSWAPGRGVAVEGVRGADLGSLVVGRLGYSGLATTDTALALTVEDENGILPALPPQILIPAGETTAAVPLQLNDVAGTAVITASTGEQSVQVNVRSLEQSWSSLAAVRIPLGAVAPVPFMLAHAQRAPRDVSAAIGDPQVAGLAEADNIDEVLPGERAWFFHLRGEMLGATEVELTSLGLPSLTVPVEVVPATVEIRDGRLELSGLDGSREGAIHLQTPDGVRVTALDLPPEAEDYVAVDGLGTEQVVLRFTPSADLPATLSLPIVFDGALGAEQLIDVFDTMHAQGENMVGYHIPVR